MASFSYIDVRYKLNEGDLTNDFKVKLLTKKFKSITNCHIINVN